MAEKIRMPSSQGGLISFSDEGRSKVELSPTHAVIMIIIVIAIILMLHSTGASIIGV